MDAVRFITIEEKTPLCSDLPTFALPTPKANEAQAAPQVLLECLVRAGTAPNRNLARILAGH